MKNPGIQATFENRILTVKFHGNALIDAEDLEEVYGFADRFSNGKPYGVLFIANSHYEVTDEALEYMTRNPHNKNVLAKAYVVNAQELKTKVKLPLTFDKHRLQAFTFSDRNEAQSWLNKAIEESGQ